LKSGGGADAVQWGLSTDFSAPGDYDGDGKFDYCVQRPGATPTSQATFFALKSGGGVTVFDWGLSNDLAVPGDYDGDGKTDFAVVREGATPDTPLIWFIFQSQTSTGRAVSWGATGSDLTVQNDYDGDGMTDIAVWRDSTGTFFIIRSSGGVGVFNWGTSNDFPVAGYDTH
jgi:spore coat protein A, manganese oxidase